MYSTASSMEEEGLGAWLGLGIGGGGGDLRRSHGEGRAPPSTVHFEVLFPERVKEERGCDGRRDQEQAVGKKRGKGGRRVKVGGSGDGDGDGDRRRSHGERASGGGGGDGDGDGDGGARKKLRLTKEQSTLLEDSFRVQNILSHAQKQELARQLNLSPRQVEVWFQNRRARTKLKQTEVDCEFLKRCCQSLTDENRRLKHELVELQRAAAAAAAIVNFCPSCDKVTVMSAGETSSKSSSSCP